MPYILARMLMLSAAAAKLWSGASADWSAGGRCPRACSRCGAALVRLLEAQPLSTSQHMGGDMGSSSI
jgi:hypothetical protein